MGAQAQDADLLLAGSSWQPGDHYVIGTPVASYPIASGVAAGALRDLPRLLAL
jgi:hypothetical protein